MDIKDLNSLLKEMNPLSDLGTDSEYTKIDEWISTGNHVLNAAMSGDIHGGIPNNRITCFAGPSGCLYPGEKIKVYKMSTRKRTRDFIGKNLI